ncbi:hypothetical protein ACFPRL_21545 [Pseudoclavibacter helvolus]
MPWSTLPRMTALSPGQSPPLVSSPIFMRSFSSGCGNTRKQPSRSSSPPTAERIQCRSGFLRWKTARLRQYRVRVSRAISADFPAPPRATPRPCRPCAARGRSRQP